MRLDYFNKPNKLKVRMHKVFLKLQITTGPSSEALRMVQLSNSIKINHSSRIYLINQSLTIINQPLLEEFRIKGLLIIERTHKLIMLLIIRDYPQR